MVGYRTVELTVTDLQVRAPHPAAPPSNKQSNDSSPLSAENHDPAIDHPTTTTATSPVLTFASACPSGRQPGPISRAAHRAPLLLLVVVFSSAIASSDLQVLRGLPRTRPRRARKVYDAYPLRMYSIISRIHFPEGIYHAWSIYCMYYIIITYSLPLVTIAAPMYVGGCVQAPVVRGDALGHHHQGTNHHLSHRHMAPATITSPDGHRHLSATITCHHHQGTKHHVSHRHMPMGTYLPQPPSPDGHA